VWFPDFFIQQSFDLVVVTFGYFCNLCLDLGTIFMFKHAISTLGLSDRAYFLKK